MQRETFKPLRLAAITLCSGALSLGLAACGSPQTAGVKPTESESVATAAPAPEPLSLIETAADSPLVDPSPERLVLGARYGQTGAVTYLLDGGMDVDARDAYGNTALIAAASDGRKQMVSLLLARGADVNATNKKDLTALMGAAVKGDYQLVHQLIKVGAAVNARNNEGETALHMAVQYGHYDAVKVLLNGGANPNLRNTVRPNFDNSGFTPLMYAATHGRTRARVDWVALTRLLVDNGADPNLTSNHGEAALNYARNQNDAAVIVALKKAGAKDEQVYAGLNADESLLKAARTGDVIKVEQLLADGADPNSANKNGVLPLLAAAFEGQPKTVRALVEGGAEVNLVPAGLSQFALSKSHAPLSERELMEAAARGDTALHAAVRQGHPRVVRYLLEHDARASLANRHGETPLLVAAGNGNVGLVKLLLANAADPNTLEQDNRRNRLALAKHAIGRNSVLIVAVAKGYEEVARALIEAGAVVDYRGFMGKTPLYVAVENGRRNLVRLLLAQGADANIESLTGRSPLMAAAKTGNHRIVADLLHHGANVNAIEAPELGYAREVQAGGAGTGMTALMFAARGGHDKVVVQLLQAGAQANIHNSDGESAQDMAADAGYDDIVQLLSPGSALDSVTFNAIEN